VAMLLWAFFGVRTNPNAKGQWMGDLGSANPTCHA
jgi:hypothetical protein